MKLRPYENAALEVFSFGLHVPRERFNKSTLAEFNKQERSSSACSAQYAENTTRFRATKYTVEDKSI